MANNDYLSAKDAYAITVSKDETQELCVINLVRMAERKVKTAATMGNFDTLWRIPLFDCDLPPYDTALTAKKLIQHFRKQGFYCKALGDVLYISWRYTQAEVKQQPRFISRRSCFSEATQAAQTQREPVRRESQVRTPSSAWELTRRP